MKVTPDYQFNNLISSEKIEDEYFESTRSPDTTGDSLCSVSVFNSGAENLE